MTECEMMVFVHSTFRAHVYFKCVLQVLPYRILTPLFDTFTSSIHRDTLGANCPDSGMSMT